MVANKKQDTKKKTPPKKPEVVKPTGNMVNDILMEVPEEEETVTKQEGLRDMLKEMGISLFHNYPKKTSVLSFENIDGMVQIDVLNKYMGKCFGYRFSVLDELVESKQTRIVSKDGFGIASFIELVKSIQATYEQHQIPEGIRGIFRR